MTQGITVSIDITQLGFETDEETGETYPGPGLQEMIVSQVVDRIVGNKIRTLDREIAESLDNVINSTVKPKILEVLDGPIQRFGRYDNRPEGEPQFLADLVMTSVSKYLSQPSSRGSISSGSVTNLGELVELKVKEALNQELKPTVDEARKQLRETVITKAIEGAVAALTPKA